MTEAVQPEGRRFVIIGLPRSGTTYLMSLLNSHQDVTCSGEVFNPYSIIETGEPDYTPAQVVARDQAPRFFMKGFFDRHEAGTWKRIGFKFMLGHNIRVLTQLPELADLAIIHVHRENKLAQVASYFKAMQTLNWAQTRQTLGMKKKVVATPQRISHQWYEFAAMDFLFANWLTTLPNRKITVEYREMFKPDFNARICDFLNIAPDPKMKSALIKQGANRVLDRFEAPDQIESYIRSLGRKDWLEEELT